jgi:mannose-6-phosphate isomerase-like protein (cupin superfamily)
MVEMKNPIKEADANPKINHLGLWRTDLAYFWVINCEANIQDDMHYHENDDHIFMVIEGECTVRTPHKEFVLKQFDTVLLKSGEPYQLCNPAREECFFWAPATQAWTASPARAYRKSRAAFR